MLVFSPDPAPTEIYTLSLHDALPICAAPDRFVKSGSTGLGKQIFNVLTTTDHKMISILYMSLAFSFFAFGGDRKSTRLNSSHVAISYAVFCLKKKITIVSISSASCCR